MLLMTACCELNSIASLSPYLPQMSAARLRFSIASLFGPAFWPGAHITIGQSSATAFSQVSSSTSNSRTLSVPVANSQPYSQPSVQTGIRAARMRSSTSPFLMPCSKQRSKSSRRSSTASKPAARAAASECSSGVVSTDHVCSANRPNAPISPPLSLERSARSLHDRRPFGNFRLDIGVKLFRRIAGEVHPEIDQLVPHVRIVERRHHAFVQRRDDRRRRAGRRDQAMPCGCLEAGDRQLCHGGDVRQQRRARERRDSERPQRATPEVLADRRNRCNPHWYVTGKRVLQRQSGSPMRHMDDVDFGLGLQQLTR